MVKGVGAEKGAVAGTVALAVTPRGETHWMRRCRSCGCQKVILARDLWVPKSRLCL